MAQTADFELLLDVEIESLQRALVRYAEATGRSLGAVVRQETRLIAWNLAHNTQPYGMTKEQEKTMNKAIARDIGKVYFSTKKARELIKAEDPKLAKKWAYLVLRGDYRAAQRLLQDESSLHFRNTPINDLMERELHQRYRNHRGRVNRHRPAQLIPDGKQIERYTKEIQQRAGYAKAGWITAGSRVGSITRVPAWITRHRGVAPGSAEDRSHDKTNPHITLTNHVRYISRILPDDEVAKALRIQREKMLAHIEHVLTEEAKAAGFTAQPTGPATPLPMAA